MNDMVAYVEEPLRLLWPLSLLALSHLIAISLFCTIGVNHVSKYASCLGCRL